jgi:oligosaccharide repeat unit polymerase
VKYHPASLMLRVWAFCILTYLILPFRLENRSLTVYGFLILALFIFCFCFGTLIASGPKKQAPPPTDARINFSRSDTLLKVAAMATILAFGYDLLSQEVSGLAGAYDLRSDSANDLLIGAASDASLAFQIGFLLYPASYVYIVREIAFKEKPAVQLVTVFGLIPVLFASLAMGGRAPLFYAILLVGYGFVMRRTTFGGKHGHLPRASSKRSNAAIKLLLFVSFLLATRYFVDVFIVRAENAGGVAAMFDVARDNWGVKFDGYLADFLFFTLGDEYTYLIFIFSWYLVQGLVMSNVLFTDYAGPAHLGVYGIDLAAALARRIDGDFVAERFGALLQLNTYGFLPSAFGSLYVDLFFFGLAVCMIWGWLAGLVYRRVKQADDPRWVLLVPFINLGIIFSLVNTPIGFSNGFVIYLWLLFVFFTAKKTIVVSPAAQLINGPPLCPTIAG